jgi:predicted DNA-binding transcriptional regulator YafY
MRYEKAETVLKIALDMQGTAEGLSLEDIQRNYADKPLSRSTAERLRNAIERVFPSMYQANEGEVPKRWRLPPNGAASSLAAVSAEDLAALATASTILRRENMALQAAHIDDVTSKLRAQLKGQTIVRLDPDLEALTEAEGLAMRPGPRPRIDPNIVGKLRQAVLSNSKVRMQYRYRGSGKSGFDTVHPYGFLFGNRHYLIAWSENPDAEDFRSFSLSNIEDITVLNLQFRKQKFSLKEFSERSFGVFQEEPVQVVWQFSAKVAANAKEFEFHPTQKMTEKPDGSLVVSFRAGGILEMAWHLFTWGDEVKVIKPIRLQKLLHSLRQGPTSAGD